MTHYQSDADSQDMSSVCRTWMRSRRKDDIDRDIYSGLDEESEFLLLIKIRASVICVPHASEFRNFSIRGRYHAVNIQQSFPCAAGSWQIFENFSRMNKMEIIYKPRLRRSVRWSIRFTRFKSKVSRYED